MLFDSGTYNRIPCPSPPSTLTAGCFSVGTLPLRPILTWPSGRTPSERAWRGLIALCCADARSRRIPQDPMRRIAAPSVQMSVHSRLPILESLLDGTADGRHERLTLTPDIVVERGRRRPKEASMGARPADRESQRDCETDEKAIDAWLCSSWMIKCWRGWPLRNLPGALAVFKGLTMPCPTTLLRFPDASVLYSRRVDTISFTRTFLNLQQV
jgi:hypothetical protein